jgi:hypothetical protein
VAARRHRHTVLLGELARATGELGRLSANLSRGLAMAMAVGALDP